MRLSDDIKPISFVKANTGKVLEQVNSAGPVIITQNGEAAAVLMGVRDYERLTEGVAMLKIIALGEKSLDQGKGVPAGEAFARIREATRKGKHNG